MMEWAAIVVAEPGNVAHVFAKDQREGVYGCIVYTLYGCMSVYAVYAVYAVSGDRGRGTVRACCIRQKCSLLL